MAYINVAEWTPDQVTDWLKGLDDSMYNYVNSFTNNEVDGKQLLNIRPYELEQLGMVWIGHQEIVLEAVEHLRNFHYNIDKENLQFLALHVATTARNLYKQLAYHCDKSKLETQILNDISRTIATTKPIIGWLDRTPFKGQHQFNEIRKNMLRLGLEMAASAQRDRFVENPVDQIRILAEKLAKLADYIIQDITDPMLLQPCALNLVTLKKRESELGFSVIPSYHGIHQISDIKHNSPAHNSGKIEDGDEIVQINYQTVVGWQYKTVMMQLRDSPPDVLITLKKCPKHTKIYGQIYMQPYRLPSKKRALPGRWGDNLPSPRPAPPNVLAVEDFTLPLKIAEKHNSSDSDSSCSDILTPTDLKSPDNQRLYMPKPRAVLQRRNTIGGTELAHLKNVGNIPFWDERKNRQNGEASSPSLRDKSVSFGFGLEIAARPATCLGLAGNSKFSEHILGAMNNSLPQISLDKQTLKGEGLPLKEGESGKSKPGVSKVVRFDASMKCDSYPVDNKYTCNVENTILETFEPIPYADEDDASQCFEEDKSARSKESSAEPVQCINTAVVSRRGRLDKSHSTPAYDNTGEDSDTPPAIEPRKEFLQVAPPPAPPPRPKRQAELQPPAIPPSPKPQLLLQQQDKGPPANQSTPLKQTLSSLLSSNTHLPAVSPIHQVSKEHANREETELVTPTKTKNLTLKKKNSLLAKRRLVTLKSLGTSDIQGHLYRRTKDRQGITFWAKLYFVLIETILYGFKRKDSPKANCMVVLPGFTVSLAKEVHSKQFAFKVYHQLKTLYFAAESVEALNQWMEYIQQATLQQDKPSVRNDASGSSFAASLSSDTMREIYSETDNTDDEDDDVGSKPLATPSPISTSHFSLSKSGSGHHISALSVENAPTGSPSKHEKYLGSLKKFATFKTGADKKPSSSDIPVPTAQFRSYRKVPGGTHGLQIGTNTSGIYHQETVVTAVSNQTAVTPPPHMVDRSRKQSITSTYSTDSKVGTITDQETVLPAVPDDQPYDRSPAATTQQQPTEPSSPQTDNPKKLRKNSPYNYIHASNPNLVEFNFHTSKAMDCSLPKINVVSNSWDPHNNPLGCVTLKDLMLQKKEEEAKDNYNNRVQFGVEKREELVRVLSSRKESGGSSGHHHTSGGGGLTVSNGGGGKLSKIQSRSLPKTPDYVLSFNPDDEDIKRTRTKEGLKLRDFGYEFIYGDDPASDSSKTSRSGSSATDKGGSSTWKKKTSSSSSSSHVATASDAVSVSDKSSRGGSFKKTKGKFEAFKTSSEKLFTQFKHYDHHHHKSGKSSSSQTVFAPLTLPLNKKTNIYAHSFGAGDHHHSTGGVSGGTSPSQTANIKKSHTYNSEFKDKKIESNRKNSAPIFPKFGMGTKTAKERKLLGSPSLHRAIFGRQHSNNSASGGGGSDVDHETFQPMVFGKGGSHHGSSDGANASANGDDVTIVPLHQPGTPSQTTSTNSTPDYPNMEYPPVFEPETYSLSDPNASLTLLRRRNDLNE